MNATEDAVRNVCYNALNMHTSTAMGLIVREGRGDGIGVAFKRHRDVRWNYRIWIVSSSSYA